MKILKIILIVLIVAGLIFGGYKGWGLYKQWEEKKFNEIEFLRRNQDMMVQKITDLSTTLTKVVNDTVKVQTLPKDDATYEGMKKKLIELEENAEANEEQIAKLKEELSEQRKAFLASPDRIYIKLTDDETVLMYRDESGALQPASDNIVKIIEHRDLSEKVVIPAEEEIMIKKASLKLKAGGYYSLDSTYGVIVSKGIFNLKDYSLNVSLLIQDLEDFKLIAGLDVGYEIRDNIELAVGYSTNKEFYGALRWSF